VFGGARSRRGGNREERGGPGVAWGSDVALGGSGPATARTSGALPRDSGGRRGTARLTGGPGRDRARSSVAGCGARQRGEAIGAALTSGAGSTVRPIQFSNRIKLFKRIQICPKL
jgi:hypothetical protein